MEQEQGEATGIVKETLIQLDNVANEHKIDKAENKAFFDAAKEFITENQKLFKKVVDTLKAAEGAAAEADLKAEVAFVVGSAGAARINLFNHVETNKTPTEQLIGIMGSYGSLYLRKMHPEIGDRTKAFNPVDKVPYAEIFSDTMRKLGNVPKPKA